MLDRPDILDSLYKDDLKMISEILESVTHSKEKVVHRYTSEYLQHRIKDWDLIIPKIEKGLSGAIKYLPIPWNRMMAYGAYHDNLQVLTYAKNRANLNKVQAQKLLSLAQKYKSNNALQWVRNEYAL